VPVRRKLTNQNEYSVCLSLRRVMESAPNLRIILFPKPHDENAAFALNCFRQTPSWTKSKTNSLPMRAR
jgi:hypothetical protein